MGIRHLSWDGCVNVRDLGGHPTADGGETRYASVVRADSVRGLSPAGWDALLGYGVRTIVDLRWDDELAADAPLDVPVKLVHVSLFGERNDTDRVRTELERIPDYSARRCTMYLDLLDRHTANFAAAIAAVAGAPPGVVVVHCAGGIDRTGLVSALLLRLAGVEAEHVAADYALSEANWAPYLADWINGTEDARDREWRRFLARIPHEAMLGVLEGLDSRHGGVAEYLRHAGLRDADLLAARARLRP